MSERALPRIREICLGLPETTERLSHGAPAFFVRKKMFATFMDDHHGDGRLAIWCHAAPGLQDLLVEHSPREFFVPPYVGHRGWIGMRLDRNVDWEDVSDRIADAYQIVAPEQLKTRMTSPGNGHGVRDVSSR